MNVNIAQILKKYTMAIALVVIVIFVVILVAVKLRFEICDDFFGIVACCVHLDILIIIHAPAGRVVIHDSLFVIHYFRGLR